MSLPREPSPVLPDGFWRTNPVLCAERYLGWLSADPAGPERIPVDGQVAMGVLAAKGIRLPSFALRRFVDAGYLRAAAWRASAPDPRVVGLLAHPTEPLGFVLPLRARRSDAWSIPGTLPFSPPATLSNLLSDLLCEARIRLGRAVPERMAFTFDDPLAERCQGDSMDIAALLAILDALMCGKNPFLRAACAIVRRDGTRLVSVGRVSYKMEAFRRECGRGTLLVRAPGVDDQYDEDFEHVWEVTDLASLGRRLQRAGLLSAVLEETQLSVHEMESGLAEVRRLMRHTFQYPRALELAERLHRSGKAPAIGLKPRTKVLKRITELRRHLGDHRGSARAARDILRLVKHDLDWGTHDRCADATAEYAAVLFDAHCFQEVLRLLAPWVTRTMEDSRLVEPWTRVKIWNTSGRAMVVAGLLGWDKLFARSIEVQMRADPESVTRTRGYLIHGLLRNGKLQLARDMLDRIDLDGRNAMDDWFFAFYRADLARRAGTRWIDEGIEKAGADLDRVTHPRALYFQATARQRLAQDPVGRLQKAEALLRQDLDPADPTNLHVMLIALMGLGQAAISRNARAWAKSMSMLRGFFAHPSNRTIAVYYSPLWTQRPASPSLDFFERFCGLTPYL